MRTHPARLMCIVLGVLLLVASAVSAVTAIWTGDVRWGETAVLAACCSPLVLFGSTYPGWDR